MKTRVYPIILFVSIILCMILGFFTSELFHNLIIIISLIVPLLLAFIDTAHKSQWYQGLVGKLIEHIITKRTSTLLAYFFLLVFNFVIMEITIVSHSTIDIFNNNFRFTELTIKPSGIIPSMIGGYITVYVAFITFILVAVQLASVQFSPRILRMFFPRNPQIFFLSIFFLTCIIYLVILPLGLNDVMYRCKDIIMLSSSVLCIPLFFVFVALLVTKLNVTDITRTIKERVISEIDRLYEKRKDKEEFTFKDMINTFMSKDQNRELTYTFENEGNGQENEKHKEFPVKGIKSGFIEDYNEHHLKKLNKLLENEKKTVRLKFAVGQYIHIGDIIATKTLENQAGDHYIKNLYNIGDFRSFDFDIQFGLRQLVDIAIKAVSPAVNDPTTCITCIYNITDIIVELLKFDLINSKVKRDFQNISFNEFDFARIIDQSFDQIYTWSKNDVDVTRNIIRSLGIIASRCNTLEELKVICDELIDLDIYHGYLKELDSIDMIHFKEKSDDKHVNLTIEGSLILKEELHYFCCSAFKIINEKHPNIIIKVTEKEISETSEMIDRLPNEFGKSKHTKLSYRQTFQEILEILVFTNK